MIRSSKSTCSEDAVVPRAVALARSVPRAAAVLPMVLLAAGCAVLPERQALPFERAPEFASCAGSPRAERWWQAFGDPALSAQIERGLEASFTLRAAFERLLAARAIAAGQGAALAPVVAGTADVTYRDGTGSQASGIGVQQRTLYSVGLQAAYEVDLWGRVGAAARAAEFEAAATAEDHEAAAVTLSAELAIVVCRMTEAGAQLALIESQLATNRDVLRVLEGRFAIGQSSGADVLRQRQLVEATDEQRIVVAASRDVLEHQLAALAGLPPQGPLGDLALPAALPEPAALPAVGLPADLLQRRPDVRAAFLRLESADAAVAAAVSDRYPRIDLSASIATTADAPADLFSAWIATLAGGITAPLLDGGRRRSEVERTVAVRRQRLAEYGTAVLEAFREVEDALALERHEAERIASLERQLALTGSTFLQLRNQYLNGAADFIDVLVALGDQQAIERSLLRARLSRVEQRIRLHRAIAGGFAVHRHEEAQDQERTRQP